MVTLEFNLWFEKNKPEKSDPLPTTFVMNMMLGDIVEAVFKGLMREAKIDFQNSEKVYLNVAGKKVSGTYDLVLNDAVDDIKSASDWSYRNKFESFETVSADDAFGYVGQLAGYAKAMGKKAGGWWVVNKANGSFKYIPASDLDVDKEVAKLEENVKTVTLNKFKRCYEPEEETFRGKPTGNRILGKTCSFCRYKHSCWENLQELPSLLSKAKLAASKAIEFTLKGGRVFLIELIMFVQLKAYPIRIPARPYTFENVLNIIKF